MFAQTVWYTEVRKNRDVPIGVQEQSPCPIPQFAQKGQPYVTKK